MTVMENETWPHSSYIPHYLLRGDPFASKLSREADIVAAFYICIIGVLSATGNGYVIYMTIKRKTKLKPPELLTVNLAIFDFGISVTGKPFFIVSSFSHRWLFGWEGCRFYGWAGFFFGCGSLFTMTVVSLDRYLKICHLSYGIIVFSYVMIIFKVKSSAKEISHFDARFRNNHNLEMKLTKVAMLICAGFLIAWIPYAVVSVVSAFGEPDSVPIAVSVVPTLLAKSSAMYNPIIYQIVDLKNSSTVSSCFRFLKERRHFRTSRFYTISGSLRNPPPAKEADSEM
uniref:Opsin-5 n=1 Tax=Larimichthys crocea TaxID=215358 RepID=A0A0F8BCX0_LARCR